MGLVNCPECASQVSDKATACPKCGFPIGSPKQAVATSAGTTPRDIDGPQVTGRKGGGLLSSAGKLCVRSGRLELKGLLLTKGLGEVRNLQAVKFSRSLLGSSVELAFTNPEEGKWTLQGPDLQALVPLFQSLEDQTGRKFVELPAGGMSNKAAQAVTGIVVVIVAILFGVPLMTSMFSVSDSSGRAIMPQGLGAPAPVVTKAEFDQIREGMSYEQAVRIIGASGEVQSSSDLAGFRTVMYSWMNSNGSNMNAMFQNGKLITKAQFGLP